MQIKPQRPVTAQDLRDLTSFSSSLPENDQFYVKIWINLLTPFAEAEVIPSSPVKEMSERKMLAMKKRF